MSIKIKSSLYIGSMKYRSWYTKKSLKNKLKKEWNCKVETESD